MFRSIIHQFKQFTNYILLIVAPPDLLYQEKLLNYINGLNKKRMQRSLTPGADQTANNKAFREQLIALRKNTLAFREEVIEHYKTLRENSPILRRVIPATTGFLDIATGDVIQDQLGYPNEETWPELETRLIEAGRKIIGFQQEATVEMLLRMEPAGYANFLAQALDTRDYLSDETIAQQEASSPRMRLAEEIRTGSILNLIIPALRQALCKL